MTPEEINKVIAEKVMGWKFDAYLNMWITPCIRKQYCDDSFNPAERWDHAGMVLEKFPNWKMEKNETSYFCKIGTCFDRGLYDHGAWADTASAAICLAALLQIGVDVQAQEAVKNV